ncbi:hypothetical protein A2631_05965 [Candidatus Daviesbacteria bacterium RIFCSPHIGHO2_01_FULL_44_29]|uniref:Uncharacterized protein n=1 Tax=Candidatus Daviesbacteria bacterium RIFCSPHIGHO2_02_FULL_43_12 TaxID=1797776 RepID=A0A1F5KJZ2_9BACT|nr:MAG: hypothetical protein A2631_05965 [Candidatus Daviesbacteria bacterium RIFCSPHIGHO2_01_FULL_44_29]OGE39139.1 MAG: hypothetical protein A3E86_03295 [Candidatus Daviesbacteria bacterium RIFCSPHIGHO2_12_FULL_47_45]OGE40941.1 MAG: hypothetical protein A3D25_02795 [Candidatus Daviesbacteria bacterium RIFCSPHIGHO2_02_FULL_43_12]OGE69908.1 MAG: hypothetical protein A3B55_05875 [Candidatus Daviesbacteria bacterium RIFCSPLOWO2_01_FULL_43_15]
MFIWRGYGFLVPLVSLFSVILVPTLLGKFTGGTENWMVSAGFVLAGFVIWFMTQKLTSRAYHTFFFLRMDYWAYVIGALGLVSFFAAH